MTTYLRFRSLQERGIVESWTTLYRWQRERGFPRGIKIGNSRLFNADEIERWLAEQTEKVA